MSQSDPDGPKNLRKLFGDMTDYVRQHSRGNLPSQKAKAKETPSMPHNVCRVCNAGFNLSKIVVERPVMSEPCPDCNAQLKQGRTALCNGTRHAFVTMPDTCSDMRGMIIDLTKEEFDRVAQKANEKPS